MINNFISQFSLNQLRIMLAILALGAITLVWLIPIVTTAVVVKTTLAYVALSAIAYVNYQ
jgi:hypothetical protein